MKNRFKKFMHLIIVECKTNRDKLKELWEKTDNITVKPKYSLFVKERYPLVKQAQGHLSRSEIMRILKDEWQSMSEEDKVPFMVIEDKKQRPLTPYNRFYKEKYRVIKSEEPSLKLPQISKQISVLWKNLDPELKKSYSSQEDLKYQQIKNKHANTVPTKLEEVELIETAPEKGVCFSLQSHVSEYFLKGTHSKPIDQIREEDCFLSKEEKDEILSNIEFLSGKELKQLIKIFENNYDESAGSLNKEAILEKVYINERKNMILNNWEEKSAIIPQEFVRLGTKDKEFLEQKKESLLKMEYWAVYLNFKKTFPEEEEDEERPQKEMIDRILNEEEKRMVRNRKCLLMGIPIN